MPLIHPGYSYISIASTHNYTLLHGHLLITLQLRKRPLAASEFVAPLAKIDPIYKEEEGAFKVS